MCGNPASCLRCTGLAGEAFFTLADAARAEIEPRLRAEIGPDAVMEWGTSHHSGMTDIAAILAAPLPWDDHAAGQHVVDAAGRRGVVALLRVVGGGFWGGEFACREGGEACLGKPITRS